MGLSRMRHSHRIAVLLFVGLTLCPTLVLARSKSHGLSYFGDLKYPPDFKHFEYVNPDAPKGGAMRTQTRQFDSLNPFIRKGTAPTGLLGQGTAVFERLMTDADDEPSSLYGVIAESVEVADDFSWISFDLREQARWHDGVPITVDDVIFSYETFRDEGSPNTRMQMRDVLGAEQSGPRTVTFHLRPSRTARLAQSVARMFVIPKHYWATRDFDKTTLEPPLGSGPYRVVDVSNGVRIDYERVDDWWGKDLPVNVGRYNFDRVRYEAFGNEELATEAIKAGVIDAKSELVSKIWAIGYDFEGHDKGLFVRNLIKTRRPQGMQYGLMFNLRNPMYQDVRVREALSYAYDFEWANRVLFYDFYGRTYSFFTNSEMAATELPSSEELALLEPYRGEVPDRVFSEAYKPTPTTGTGVPRANLLKADRLLEAAGWIVNDRGERVSRDTGEQLSVDYITVSIYNERSIQPYIANLNKLGIRAQIRAIEASQYINRLGTRDFDATIVNYPQTMVPGLELRSYYGSRSGAQNYGRNIAGIDDPVVDALIEKIIAATSYGEMVTAGRALDRVMLWNFYAIPGYYPPGYRYVYWDKYGVPDASELTRSGFFDLWWYDKAKAARVESYLPESVEL